MFRLHKTLDTITLFHRASSPASMRVAAMLKQASARATETATEDQAGDHSAQHQGQQLMRDQFELQITEDPPTTDQLRTILEYVGKPTIGSVVKGSTTESEAMRKFKESAENFQRPVVVDWNNGKALAGAEESKIIAMLNSQSKN